MTNYTECIRGTFVCYYKHRKLSQHGSYGTWSVNLNPSKPAVVIISPRTGKIILLDTAKSIAAGLEFQYICFTICFTSVFSRIIVKLIILYDTRMTFRYHNDPCQKKVPHPSFTLLDKQESSTNHW